MPESTDPAALLREAARLLRERDPMSPAVAEPLARHLDVLADLTTHGQAAAPGRHTAASLARAICEAVKSPPLAICDAVKSLALAIREAVNR